MPKKTPKKSKTKPKKVAKRRAPAKPAPKLAKYFAAVGRRKTAVARVRLFIQREKTFLVNKKPLEVYFPIFEQQRTVIAPLEKMKCLDEFKILTIVKGGGLSSQAKPYLMG